MEEDDYEISMNPVTDDDKEKIKMIQELTGCKEIMVMSHYMMHKGDVILTIDSLIEKPVCKGDKFIPPPPKIDNGLTPQQQEMCLRGRELQDKVNVVFSVAHSKTRTPQDHEVAGSQQKAIDSSPAQVSLPGVPQDADEKTSQ